MTVVCKVLKAALGTTHEIVKLIKYSPHGGTLFCDVKGELGEGNPGF